MTISNVLVKTAFPGDGTAAIRTTTFVLSDLSELRVTRVDSLGVETVLVSPTDFTAAFTSTAPAPVQITPAAAIAAGDTWHAYRDVAKTQSLDYTAADLFPAESHESGLDRLTLIVQELGFHMQRAMRSAPQDDDVDMTIPRKADRLGKVAAYDPATGAPVVIDTDLFVPGAFPVGAFGELLLALTNQVAAQTLIQFVQFTNNIQTLGAGLAAARPASWPNGLFGPYLATDSGEISQYDGVWTELGGGIRRGTLAARPAAATAGAKFYYAEDVNNLYHSNGAVWSLRRTLSPGAMKGLGLTWNAATLLTVAAGAARDSGDALDLVLSAGQQKVFNVAGDWTAGAGGNMRPNTVANTNGLLYHLFLIGNGTTGATEWGIDSDSAGINLIPKVSAVMGAGFGSLRRLGYVWNDSTTGLHRFFQDGDEFLHYVPKDGYIDAGTADYATAGQNRTLAFAAPRCVNRGTLMWASVGTANAVGLLTSPQQASAAPLMTGTPGAMLREAATEALMSWNQYVDLNGQVHFRSQAASDVNTSLRVIVHGWTDRRGKDA